MLLKITCLSWHDKLVVKENGVGKMRHLLAIEQMDANGMESVLQVFIKLATLQVKPRLESESCGRNAKWFWL